MKVFKKHSSTYFNNSLEVCKVFPMFKEALLYLGIIIVACGSAILLMLKGKNNDIH